MKRGIIFILCIALLYALIQLTYPSFITIGFASFLSGLMSYQLFRIKLSMRASLALAFNSGTLIFLHMSALLTPLNLLLIAGINVCLIFLKRTSQKGKTAIEHENNVDN